jgi:hypothetical protein
MHDFNITDQSIDQKAPIRLESRMYVSKTDVFRDQLIYALKGEPKYSNVILSDVTTLDFVWI